MRVVFAEKPSMGRAIAGAIGLSGSGKTHIRGRDLKGRDVVVTWGIGHLVALVEGFEAYDPAMKVWKSEHLPFIPPQFKTAVVTNSKDQFQAVKQILSDPGVEDVVVATDAGREGELIALYTFEKIGVKKPTLRLWVSSLTDEAIREGYGQMKPWSEYKPLQDSAQCRSEADWIVGLNGTRAITLMARRMGRKEHGAWAVGRVMTPTLAILVQRELEIRQHVPKDFWTLEGAFQATGGAYKGKWFGPNGDRIESEAQAKALLNKVQGKPARVAKLETREVRRNPESFFDLTGLQKEANKRFGFTAAETLEIAQELYEAKVLSYPRTNSCHLTEADERKAPGWLKAVGHIPEYAPFVAEILKNGGPAKLGKRYVDDSQVEDHSALVPSENAATGLTPRQTKIYDMVVRRFLAAWFTARVEAKTILITEIEGETFRSNGTVVLEEGWSAVDPASISAKKVKKKGKTADEDEEEEAADGNGLPKVQENQAVQVVTLSTTKKQTEPPKRLTEADLLAAMQSAGKDLDDDELKEAMKAAGVTGIGTPATRAATIEKLLSKGSPKFPKDPLVERKGKLLIPTQRGIDLIQLVPDPSLKSAEMTGRWEAQLEAVRTQKNTRATFMKNIAAYTQDLVASTLGQAPSGDSMSPGDRFQPLPLPDPCPKCGGKVELRCWDGQYSTKCTSQGCYFGFDADEKGQPTGKCPHCGTGRLRTTKNRNRVCADCDKWEVSKGGGGGFRQEGPRASGSGAGGQQLGECPKCHKGRLSIRNGQYGYFVSCSERCGLTYGCDEAGNPDGGHCKFCKGPAKKTQSGSMVCAVCGKWQDEKSSPTPSLARGNGGGHSDNRPAKPKDASCPRCREKMKTVFTRRNKWAFRCDPCDFWQDAG